MGKGKSTAQRRVNRNVGNESVLGSSISEGDQRREGAKQHSKQSAVLVVFLLYCIKSFPFPLLFDESSVCFQLKEIWETQPVATDPSKLSSRM